MYRSSSSAGVVVLLLLASSVRAAPSPAAEFQRNVAEAKAHFDSQSYEQAIDSLRAAYLIQPLPRLLMNMGSAFRKLNRHAEAVTYYDRYLREDVNIPAADRSDIEAYLLSQRPKPPPPVVALPPPPRRPLWRLLVGGLGAAAGAGLLGYGVYGIVMDGRCTSSSCGQVNRSLQLGVGLYIAGTLLMGGGVVLLVLPPPRAPSLALGWSGAGLTLAGRF